MRAPDFWSKTTPTARAIAAALTPLGWAYASTIRYKSAHARPYRSSAKVICIGNVTAGGTGKTPVAIAIARRLAERNRRACILTRGYGGQIRGPAFVHPAEHTLKDVGDEALLAARSAPVVISRHRALGAKLAEAQGLSTIVMDDGFQNFSLEKDLSFLVIDAATLFGNGHVLPAGPLREPVSRALARAHALIIMGDQDVMVDSLQKPVIRAKLVPSEGLMLAGRRVLGFAGIGSPEKFFNTLRDMKAALVATQAYPDHHRYTPREMNALKVQSRKIGAELVTTEKDYVRLPPSDRAGITPIPVEVQFEDETELSRLLDEIEPNARSLSQ